LLYPLAQVAELVDALGSGPSGGNTVEVRVLSWAPRSLFSRNALMADRSQKPNVHRVGFFAFSASIFQIQFDLISI
jgi:hypothetical protein